MAQHFERQAFSFRSFIGKLEADAEQGEIDEAPIVEEGTEGVRILTVHKAKGLEFPVVILADPTCTATHSAPSRHVDPARRLWLEPLCGSTPIELLEAAAEESQRDRRSEPVHCRDRECLASIDLDADLESIRSMAAVIGRMVTATEDEVSAASIAVRAVLEHPILRRAAASSGSGRLRRETPVLHRLENGELIEGVVDLAFQEEDSTFTGWTVIDFKTDREPGPSSDRYVAQVRMYAQAIATATALPARGVVLVI
jgi:ATP-dependent exoDNAse (exonuclease V) beta subunit